MKNKMIILSLLVLMVLILSNSNKYENSIEDALLYSSSKNTKLEIVHKERINKGYIVFSVDKPNDKLHTALIRENFLEKYKCLYDGRGADATKVAKEFDLSSNYFPSIKKIKFPMYYGIIGNEDIAKVKIKEVDTSYSKTAKVIDKSGIKIWFVDMNGFTGSEFNIIGTSSDGKEVVNIIDDISPYRADQPSLSSNY